MADRVLNFSEFAGKYSQDSETDASAGYSEFSKSSDKFTDAFDETTYDQPQLGPKRPVAGGNGTTPAQPGAEGAPAFTSSPSGDMKFGAAGADTSFQSFSGGGSNGSFDAGTEYPDVEGEEEEGEEGEYEEGEEEAAEPTPTPTTSWDEDGGNPEEGEEEEGEEEETEEGEEEEEEGEEEEEETEEEEEEGKETPNESLFWKKYNAKLILESFMDEIEEEGWEGEEEGEEEEWSEEGWEDIDYSEFGANPYAEEEEIELEDYFGEEEEEGYDEDLYNLIMGGDTKIKPTTAPPTTTPGTRPWRPVPTKRPSEREKSKPIAGFDFNIEDEEGYSDEMEDFVKCKSCGEKKMIDAGNAPFKDEWWKGHEMGMQCGCNM